MVLTAFVVAAALANAGAAEMCASHVAPQTGDRLQATAFKGVELYSWPTPEGPRFALLWGTNRNKTEAETKSSGCVLSTLGELKAALSRLAPGELIAWSNLEEGHSLKSSAPPRELVADLSQYAKSTGVTLELMW